MKIGAKWVGTSNEEGDRPKATVEGIRGTPALRRVPPRLPGGPLRPMKWVSRAVRFPLVWNRTGPVRSTRASRALPVRSTRASRAHGIVR